LAGRLRHDRLRGFRVGRRLHREDGQPMPVHWTISHAHQLVVAVATAPTTVEDVERYVSEIQAEGGLRYRKMFVAEPGSTFSLDDIKRLGVVMHQYAKQTDLGPLAIVISSDEQLAAAAEYVKAAAAGRPVAFFRGEQDAREWLMDRPLAT
jgi:phage-related protein